MRRLIVSSSLFIVLGLVLSITFGCEEWANPPASTVDKTVPTAPPETAPSAKPGTLVVTAGSDLPFKVFAVDGDKEVAHGTCNIHQPELAPGAYRVVVEVPGAPAVGLDPVTVETGKKVTANLAGFGSMKVGAAQDFMKYEVKNAAGAVVARGDANISTLGLPVGTYTVVADAGRFGPQTIEGVVVEENKEANPKVKGFGQITVKAAKDFVKYKIIAKDGTEVGAGDTNITTLLVPVGEYTVVAGDKSKTKLVVADGDRRNFGIEL